MPIKNQGLKFNDSQHHNWNDNFRVWTQSLHLLNINIGTEPWFSGLKGTCRSYLFPYQIKTTNLGYLVYFYGNLYSFIFPWRQTEKYNLTVLVDERTAFRSVHVGPRLELDVPQFEHWRGHLERGKNFFGSEAQHVKRPL